MMQFYENMRFPEDKISYEISRCSLQKEHDAKRAFDILSNLTVLDFYETEKNGEIFIACEERNRVENKLFIAGEGGPINITSIEKFNVIFKGEILLIKNSKCENPNVAIHEVLHVLGFNHSLNPNSIMYNITKCHQTIGQDIINKINELYSTPSYFDLSFENVSAIMHGKYLDTNITIRNNGLKESQSSTLIIYADEKEIKKVQLETLKVGYGTTITLGNVLVPKININELIFLINNSFRELEKNNNKIKLEIKN